MLPKTPNFADCNAFCFLALVSSNTNTAHLLEVSLKRRQVSPFQNLPSHGAATVQQMTKHKGL